MIDGVNKRSFKHLPIGQEEFFTQDNNLGYLTG